jgi:pyruvate formate lyase activating enzyme
MMKDSGMIFNIQKFSLQDGPGIRTTIFMKGCPLQCKWCSNPESQSRHSQIWALNTRCNKCGKCLDVCELKAIRLIEEGIAIDNKKCNLCYKCVEVCPSVAIERVGSYLSVEEVLREIEKDRPFYESSDGGVTLSGGEALYQPEFIFALLRGCKERGVSTALDTSGYASWETISRVLEYVDLVLYDIKTLSSELHKRYTGVANKSIIENFEKVTATVRTWLRISIIPGFNDSESEMESIAKFVAAMPLEKVSLFPFHHWGQSKYFRLGRRYPFDGVQVPSEADMHRYKKIFEIRGLEVEIDA